MTDAGRQMIEFDEAASRAVEEVYGTADVVEQRRVVIEALAPAPDSGRSTWGAGPACWRARSPARWAPGAG